MAKVATLIINARVHASMIYALTTKSVIKISKDASEMTVTYIPDVKSIQYVSILKRSIEELYILAILIKTTRETMDINVTMIVNVKRKEFAILLISFA